VYIGIVRRLYTRA